MKLKVGSKISWQWLGRSVHGSVQEVHHESITRTIKGKQITRHGSKEKPAYVVKSEAGNIALKLITELNKDSRKEKSNKDSPEMFKN